MTTLLEKSIDHIHQHATGQRPFAPFLPPLIAASLFTLIFLAMGFCLKVETVWGLAPFPPWPWNLFVGGVLFFPGLFLVNWSVFTFARAGGTPVPIAPPPALVTTGPYAYSRNPMMAGLIVMLLGVGALLSSLTITFGLVPALMILVWANIRFIEEPELEKRLGKEYRQYLARTPRFFPVALGRRGKGSAGAEG